MAADITRLFKGAKNEFEVEVVFAKLGDQSPKEPHTYEELILVLDGTIKLERSDTGTTTHKSFELIHLPAGTVHQITPQVTPTKILVIHPDREDDY